MPFVVIMNGVGGHASLATSVSSPSSLLPIPCSLLARRRILLAVLRDTLATSTLVDVALAPRLLAGLNVMMVVVLSVGLTALLPGTLGVVIMTPAALAVVLQLTVADGVWLRVGVADGVAVLERVCVLVPVPLAPRLSDADGVQL